MTLDDLRHFAVSRSLFAPVTIRRAIETLGFVQADPIRAPARAQDLTLRHRVKGYRAGDLERLYARLPIEEDVLVNYGFVSRRVYELMHPRERRRLPETPRTRADKVLAFVRDRGEVHPREVDAHFSHGTVTNYWGGSSSATTHLLERLHYAGRLRVTRRERGIRIYAFRDGHTAGDLSPRDRVDALVDVVVHKYAPLPALSLSYVVGRLRYAVPQWRGHLKAALARARKRLAHERVDGVDWYRPAGERPRAQASDDAVRLLAPFDPVVWDRRRFELLWGWPYRFEAYTPVVKRRFGYYALPILWREHVIGWANVSVVREGSPKGLRYTSVEKGTPGTEAGPVEKGALRMEAGYVSGGAPRDRIFARELEAELARIRSFLALEP